MNMPPGPSGKDVAIGSTSLPWHISSKTKYADVGAALHQLAHHGAGLGAADVRPEPDPGRRHGAGRQGQRVPDVASPTAGRQLVKSGGLTLFPDWASTNMLTVMGTEFQKMIAGRQSPADTAKTIQSEWTTFDKTLK